MFPEFKVLYMTINENVSSGEEGVSRKLMAKVEAIGRMCSGCTLLNSSLNPEHDGIKVIARKENLIDIEIGVNKANKGYLNRINRDIFFYAQLQNFIKHNLNFDKIIFRYPNASEGLRNFSKAFYKKIVFEHNTKELEELRLQISAKNYVKFSLRPSQFFYWYQEKRYPLYAEKYISKEVMKNAFAGACVTTEIANYEKARFAGYRTFVSSNFYDVKSTPPSGSVYKGQDTRLTIGMIVTSMATWYGLDRVFRSFSPVKNKYRLIIAGIDSANKNMLTLLRNNNLEEDVVLAGKLNASQIHSFYNTVHVCLGSLGLYNINLNYASTLKVKESLAFGVPVVVGYKEEDFGNKEFGPYYLQVANDPSLIDFDKVEVFVRNFYEDHTNRIKLRELALKYLDVDVKVKSLLKNIQPD